MTYIHIPIGEITVCCTEYGDAYLESVSVAAARLMFAGDPDPVGRSLRLKYSLLCASRLLHFHGGTGSGEPCTPITIADVADALRRQVGRTLAGKLETETVRRQA